MLARLVECFRRRKEPEGDVGKTVCSFSKRQLLLMRGNVGYSEGLVTWKELLAMPDDIVVRELRDINQR